VNLSYSKTVGDVPRQWRLYQLIATATGRYDFVDPNLNSMVDVQATGFQDWLFSAWSQEL
jgi:hypothetical protein